MVVDASEWFKRLAENTGAGESKDGKGSGDHDTPFVWGNPRACLTTRMQAKLLIMRGYVRDARNGARGGAFDGDSDWVAPTPFGVLVPTDPNAYWGDDG